MLSYQHAYHAGNFADCHKHGVLCALLASLHTKDSALTCYDFFAGRGMYSLESPEANKTGEYIHGIGKLWEDGAPAPDALKPYLHHVIADNPDGLEHYAGSPLLIKRSLRPQDRLLCVDAHPQEHFALEHVLGLDPRLVIHKRDAWEALGALLPPQPPHKTPRALAVIDPAYEVKEDYAILVAACANALERMRHAMILIWYPLLASSYHETMLKNFQQTITTKTLHSQLHVSAPPERGMYGSGLLIVNPPWQFENTVNEIGDYLTIYLAQDKTAKHVCEWIVGE